MQIIPNNYMAKFMNGAWPIQQLKYTSTFVMQHNKAYDHTW